MILRWRLFLNISRIFVCKNKVKMGIRIMIMNGKG